MIVRLRRTMSLMGRLAYFADTSILQRSTVGFIGVLAFSSFLTGPPSFLPDCMSRLDVHLI